jgi:hypothetical protein
MAKRNKKHAYENRIQSVRSFVENNPGFNEGGIRWIIYQNKDQLLESEAIFYCGSRLLIDDDRFISAIKQGGLNHG